MVNVIAEMPTVQKLASLEQIDFLLGNIPNLLIGFPGHRPGGLLMSILLALLAWVLFWLLFWGQALNHAGGLCACSPRRMCTYFGAFP